MSSSDVPWNPFRQNTSRARSSASSGSKLRGRAIGPMYVLAEKIAKCGTEGRDRPQFSSLDSLCLRLGSHALPVTKSGSQSASYAVGEDHHQNTLVTT